MECVSKSEKKKEANPAGAQKSSTKIEATFVSMSSGWISRRLFLKKRVGGGKTLPSIHQKTFSTHNKLWL